MKILLVLNKPNREIPIMESIKMEIYSINPSAHVAIREMCSPGFNRFVLKYRPNVILTFPFTCVGFSSWYYLFKILFNTKIICLRAEGVVNDTSKEAIDFITGFDKYGKQLVDYELFWGSKSAELIGGNLLRQDKISSLNRVKIVGYPRLETYFSQKEEHPSIELPARILTKLGGYSRQHIIFFVTGFHLANYSKQDLFDAKDLDAENRADELLKDVEKAKQFRAAWIDNIIRTAKDNPQLLFIVKKHPIERREDYQLLESQLNVLYIHEDIEIQHIIRYANLFFHYGSTSVVDAYLSHIPSIYVSPDEDIIWYSHMGWPYSKQITADRIPETVREYKAGQITFRVTQEINKVLKDIFNIEEEKPYAPSRKIAELILQKDPAQKIELTDIYLWKSIISVFVISIINVAGGIIKKILRMDPNAPLLKKKCAL